MRKNLLSLLSLLIVLAIISPSCFSENKVLVVVSVGTITPIVYEVGGSRVSVVSIVPPGVDPHEFTPDPNTISFLSKASLVVVTGHISWENNLKSSVKGEFLNILEDLNDNITLLSLPANLGGGKNLHGFWLFPSNARAIALAIAKKLSVIDPNYSEYYMDNFKNFEAQLEQISSFAHNYLKSKDLYLKEVVSVTPDAQYLLTAYGFNVSQILVNEGEGVRPDVLSRIVSGLKGKEFVLIVASDLSTTTQAYETARSLSKDYGVPIATISTLFSGNMSYISLFSLNLGSIISSYYSSNNFTKQGLDSLHYSLIFLSSVLTVIVLSETYLLLRRRET